LQAVFRHQAARHERPVRRQLAAGHKIRWLVVVIVLTLVITGTQELAAHGWLFFVNRPPGVGSSPSRADAHGSHPGHRAAGQRGFTQTRARSSP